jgi:ribonuclease D
MSDPAAERVVELVTRADELENVVRRLAGAESIALDLESNGMFKYKATLCTLQLTAGAGVFVVDTLVTPLGALRELLGTNGPRKIIHDIAFDARILAESDLLLGNVFDTSLTARMLGKTATGLASLLSSELGITLDKKLQHHDWTERPIGAPGLRYLAEDVVHLHALSEKLRGGIRDEVVEAIDEETRYRLAQAAASAKSVDPRPPYLRLKGIDRVPKSELPLLRRLAEVREAKARSLDVPPYKVLGPEVLFAIAHARPQTLDELAKVKGATDGHRARALGPALVHAVTAGLADVEIPEDERKMLERPRLAPALVRARRLREGKLTSWRKGEAKRLGLDEQVVLPGHCLQDLADLESPTLDTIAAIPGIGAFRVSRSGAALLDALRAEAT